MTRMFDIREPSLEALRSAPVYFRYGSNHRKVLVDASTARAVLVIHENLNPENRAELERMVAGTFPEFRKIVDFAWKHVKFRPA